MNVDLEITTSEEYFAKTNREIDYEEYDTTKVSLKQSEELQKILTTECSIYLLRRVTGLCGSLPDNMVIIRRELINKYEQKHEKYITYNNFY